MRAITPELRDAARRASDTVNTYLAYRGWDEIKHCWLAFTMDTGESDGVLYESKRDAVRHQSDEFKRFYVALRGLGPGGAKPHEMAVFFQFQRDAYDAGFRLPDPDAKDGGPEVLMTAAQHDYYRGRVR